MSIIYDNFGRAMEYAERVLDSTNAALGPPDYVPALNPEAIRSMQNEILALRARVETLSQELNHIKSKVRVLRVHQELRDSAQ